MLLSVEGEQRVSRVVALYHGEEGYNCAQAILAGFADIAEGVDQAAIDAMGDCGRGRAEGGVCGALHAARQLLDESGRALLQPFVETYGSVYCTDLRPQDCCVELVAAVARLLVAISETHPLTYRV